MDLVVLRKGDIIYKKHITINRGVIKLINANEVK